MDFFNAVAISEALRNLHDALLQASKVHVEELQGVRQLVLVAAVCYGSHTRTYLSKLIIGFSICLHQVYFCCLFHMQGDPTHACYRLM